MTPHRSIVRSRTFRKLLAVGAVSALGVISVSVIAVFTPPAVYLSIMAAVLLAQIVLLAMLLQRRAADYDIQNLKRILMPRLTVEGRWPLKERELAIASLHEASNRIRHGFTAEPMRHLKRTVDDTNQAPSVRKLAAEELRKAEVLRNTPVSEEGGPVERFDVVMVSNFNLPGGTTTSNANEIRLLAEGGKKVGVFHHPLYSANCARPVNSKIADLVDGKSVKFIAPRSRVSCDLLIMRFPPFASRLREDLPMIDASEKILVINQAPMTYYDSIAGRKHIWDVATVRGNLSDWIGEHRWTTVGPLVRQALIDHHSDALGGIDLSDEFWYPTLNIDSLEQRPSDLPRRPLRIGRHSRDHLSKWPELASDLRSCYPEGPEYEIRVLGGAKAPERLLGRLPSNWTTYEFDSISVNEFLPQLDFYVYYPNSTLLEAFGRAPVEAMAFGVPTVLPPVFEPVFGDGALYATPTEVTDVITSLADDPQQYTAQQKLGMAAVQDRFSFEAHRERLRSVGVKL